MWFGIGAPKNTPVEIVDKPNKEINAGLADSKMRARFADLRVEDRFAKIRIAKLYAAEVRFADLFLPEVRPGEVRFDIGILTTPLVPGVHAPLEYRDVFVVRHGSTHEGLARGQRGSFKKLRTPVRLALSQGGDK